MLFQLLMFGFLTSLNSPPEANPDRVTVFQGQFVLIDVLANDHDQDGDFLTLILDSATLPAGSSGSVTVDGAVAFRPPPSLVQGDLFFEYQITDGRATRRARVDVTVIADGPHVRVFAEEFRELWPVDLNGLYERIPDTAPNRRTSRGFVVRNDGTQNLNFSGPPQISSPEGAFSLSEAGAPGAGDQVLPHGRTFFRVFFRPPGEGVFTATVTLPVDDPRGSFEFGIQGQAFHDFDVVSMRVEQNGRYLANGDSFDSTGGPRYRFDVTNTSTRQLQLSGFQPPDSYGVTLAPPEELGPGEAGQFEIVLQGEDFPPAEGALSFQTNIPDHELFELSENHWPIANDDYRVVEVGETLFLNLVANDSDPDDDQIKLAPSPDTFPDLNFDGVRFTTPQNGQVFRIDDRLAQYIPAAGFSGQDQFVYQIEDGRGRSTLGLVVLDIGNNPNEPTTLELVSQDHFSNADTFLNGVAVEYHRETGSTWRADPELRINGTQYLEAPDLQDETHFRGMVPFHPWLYPGQILEISGRLKLFNSKWIALAFTHGQGGVFGQEADLVFLLRPDGRGTLLASHLHVLASCDASTGGYAIDPNGFTDVAMRFDLVSREVSVWINGTRALNDVPFHDPRATVPLENSISNGGFYAVSDPGGSAAGDFGLDDFAIRKGNLFESELIVSHGGSPVQSGDTISAATPFGQDHYLSLLLENDGNRDLEIQNVQVQGDPAWVLASTLPNPLVLAPGQSQLVEVVLLGDESGTQIATLSFQTNDPGQGDFTLFLEGQVEGPPDHYLDIRRDSVQGEPVLRDDVLRYRDSFQGRRGILAHLIIDNISGQNLDLQVEVAPAGQWTVEGFTAGSLNPGNRGFLDLRANTSSTGMKRAYVTITTDPVSLPVSFWVESQVVPAPPELEITYQTGDLSVWSGDSCEFEVRVEGGVPPYVYTWETNSGCCGFSSCEVASCGMTGVTGSDSGRLQFSSVDETHVAGYFLVVTDQSGQFASSDLAQLDLRSLAVTKTPVSAFGDGSENVTFEVQAQGNGALSYQWYKDAVPISGGDSRYQGAQSPLLTLVQPDSQQEGFYHCRLVDQEEVHNTQPVSFEFLSHPDQIVDEIRSGFGDLPTYALDGKSLSFGTTAWNATDNFVYSNGGFIAEGLTASASLSFPYKAGHDHYLELHMDPTRIRQGSTIRLGFTSQPDGDWAHIAPLSMEVSFIQTGQVSVSLYHYDTLSHSRAYPLDWSDIVFLELDVDDARGVASYRVNHSFYESVFQDVPLNTSHLGLSLTRADALVESPAVTRIRAARNEHVIANGDFYQLVKEQVPRLYFDPRTNDVGTGLTLTELGEPFYGSLALDRAGNLEYTPPLNFIGTDQMTYTIVNRAGRRATGTIVIDVLDRVDRLMSLKTGRFHGIAGQSKTFDPRHLVWHKDRDSLRILDAGFHVEPDQGTVNLAGGELVYTPNPGFSGIDRFSFEVTDSSGHIEVGLVEILVRPRSGGLTWDDFDPGVGERTNGVLLQGLPLQSENSHWFTKYYPLHREPFTLPLILGDGVAEFRTSEHSLASMPLTPPVTGDAALAAEVYFVDPSSDEIFVLGFSNAAVDYFPKNQSSPAIWLALDRNGVTLFSQSREGRQTLGWEPLDPSLFLNPINTRLHLQRDGGLGLYLNGNPVWEGEDVANDRTLPLTTFQWANFGLKSRTSGILPVVHRVQLFESGPAGAPDPIQHDEFEGDLESWTETVGSVAVAPGELFGDGVLEITHGGAQPAYVAKTHPLPHDSHRARFYLNAQNLTMGIGDNHVVFQAFDEHDVSLCRIEVKRDAGGRFLRARAKKPAGGWANGPWIPLDGSVNLVETQFDLSRFVLLLDQTHRSEAIPGGSMAPIRSVRLGGVAGMDATTTGTLQLDSYQSRAFTDPGRAMILQEPFANQALSEWRLEGQNGLNVDQAYAGTGKYGLGIAHSGTTAAFLERDLERPETQLLGGFSFDPRNIALHGQSHVLFQGYDSGLAGVLRLELGQNGSGQYQVRIRIKDDSGSWQRGAWQVIPDQINQLDWRWQVEPGSAQLRIDGALVTDLQGISLTGRHIRYLRFGAISGLDPTTAGVISMDDIEITKYHDGFPQ